MKKKKKLSLSLNKQKISQLNCNQQDAIRGGVTCTVPCEATHCANECGTPSLVRECIWSEGTDDLTNIRHF